MDGLRPNDSELSTATAGGLNVEQARHMVTLALSQESQPESSTAGAVVVETSVQDRETGEVINDAERRKRDHVARAQAEVEAALLTVPQSGPVSLEALLPKE